MSKFEKLCNEYRENKRMIEELENINEELKTAIIELMEGKEELIQGATKASYKMVVSSRFDSTGFKKVYPELFTQYSTQTSYRRFTIV